MAMILSSLYYHRRSLLYTVSGGEVQEIVTTPLPTSPQEQSLTPTCSPLPTSSRKRQNPSSHDDDLHLLTPGNLSMDS